MPFRTAVREISMSIYGCEVKVWAHAVGEGDVQGACDWVQNAILYYQIHLQELALKEQEEQLRNNQIEAMEKLREELLQDPELAGRPFGQWFTNEERQEMNRLSKTVYPSAYPDIINPDLNDVDLARSREEYQARLAIKRDTENTVWADNNGERYDNPNDDEGDK